MSNKSIISNTGTPYGDELLGVTSVNNKTGAVQLNAKDVGALSQDELQSGVNLALQTAKESGKFDGKDGNDYVLTEADKQEIAQMAVQLFPVYNGEVESV